MERLAFLLILALTAALRLAAAPPIDLTVPVPEGETLLQDIGTYRVGWQSYGQAPVEMPLAWAGHFDPQTGISYLPWGKVLDRQALLMHSPWHVPPGKTWIEYRLALPKTPPARLTFGIAMGPDVATPDRSDGVTFSCRLTAAGQERELMRRHYDKAEWLDYNFDLSPYAGQTVRLLLQVEPGPKNNASFDYSFFGDAKLVAGAAKSSTQALVRQLTSTPAYQALAKASRVALSNVSTNGVAPSNLLPYENTIEPDGNGWRFACRAPDCRVVYRYVPESGTLDDFTVQLDDHPPFQPALNGGVTGIINQDGKAQTVALRGSKLVEASREGESVRVLWEYELGGGESLRVAWRFGIRGKALLLTARCQTALLSQFSLGGVGRVPLRRIIAVPYLAGNLQYLPLQQCYVGRYLDWTVSHSSMCPQDTAVYEPKTDRTRNTLLESGYIAVSPEVGEVLPNLPHPPSPYLALLGPRIMLDIWGHSQASYAGDAENLRRLKDLGVDHLAIIQHDWQRFGYDVKLPDHLPANPLYGGDEGMKAFGRVANECGYLWSLHENYIDLYPDAPSYDPAARVLRPDGSPSPAWYNPGTKVQSFGLKCNRALEFARQNSPDIHRRYGTTAAYLDVHTCVPPWHQLDHEAAQPLAAMAQGKVEYDTKLMQFLRDSHAGPLFGEGANHFYWAGRCDGVEAQVQGGEDHQPFLDFDLLKIHPQMVNHGMGYYERWFRQGYNHRLGHETGTLEQIDKYRAMELAYGHAGFVGSPQDRNWHWIVREHHLMHPVQRLYGTAKPAEILYEVEGQLVTASVALAAGHTGRQRIRYDNGLTLWVNWQPEPWPIEQRVLPQWGFLALGPQTEAGATLRQGKISDFAACPEYVFADARTYAYLPYRHEPKRIEPRLRAFEYLGGNRAQVTYEWLVHEPLDQDYNCFVHASTPKNAAAPDHIVFQQDHALPKPTGQWRAGDVIVDGPHELRMSDQFDAYDLSIGLFKGERLLLQGQQDGQSRVVIAQLKLQREGGRIVNAIAEKPAAPLLADSAPAADFTAHTNPAGAWLDFGPLATDGALKINRAPDRLVIFPYPRDRPFRASPALQQLAPAADLQRLRVRALAAGDQHDLGAADFKLEGNRLWLTFGAPGAGRYVVIWPGDANH